jgi:hypothetical protein
MQQGVSEVKSTNRDTYLDGSEDLRHQPFLRKFKRAEGIQAKNNHMAIQCVPEAAEIDYADRS